jgi:polysaccharide pyruvyl transferase CsaB
MDQANRIVLSGYYGYDNIGDEAVLYCIIQSLRAQNKKVHITVLSNNPQKTKNVYQVESVNRWKIKEVFKAIRQCDLLISGGGTLLQDVTSNRVIPYYLGVVKIAQWLKKPVVFYSQGIGPVKSRFNKWLIKKVGKKVNHIFVRDPQSKLELEKMGVQTKVTESVDPVLGLKVRKEVADKIKQTMVEGKKIGVYLRPWENTQEIVASMVFLLEGIIKKGYEIYLIPMYYHEDCPVARSVHKEFKEKVHLINRPLSIEETMAYTEQFDFIIGMRLHSLIMAAGANIPMFGLSYDPKVQDFCKMIEAPYIATAGIEKRNLSNEVDLFIQELPTYQQKLTKAYKQCKEKVDLPARYINALLQWED